MISGLLTYMLAGTLLLPPQPPIVVDSLPEPVYFEPAPDGKTRFFFDEEYYLADKDCQYKQIERLAGYNFQKRSFEGSFIDSGPNGHPLLEGAYLNGKKNGPFKAYHSNGQRKWEGTFEDDKPTGIWRYYYPDGLPFQEVNLENNRPALINFWDARGRKRVENGKGRYQFAVKIPGFNEYGYEFIQFGGPVQNGLPDNIWSLSYQFSDGQKEDAGFEQYKNGFLISGHDNYTGENYTEPKVTFVAPEYFPRAEELISKNCTIDEHLGYNEFLRKHLEAYFQEYDASAIAPQEIVFTIQVGKKGLPFKVTAITTLPEPNAAVLLFDAFRTVAYWLPSYNNGEYIDDTLTVSANIFPSPETGALAFYSVQIKRKDGI